MNRLTMLGQARGARTEQTIIVLQNTTDTNTVYAEEANSMYYWDPTKYSKLRAVYFEIVAIASALGLTVSAKLYNHDDAADIANSELNITNTNYARMRSGDVKADMPTTSKTLSVQAKISAAGTWRIGVARLIIVQAG